MIQSELLLGKNAVFDWELYKSSCLDSFVLDEENQINLLEKVLSRIGQMDNECKMYASTYPIEIKESGISAYADMIWLKTKISCDDLEKLFLGFREIEPSAIYNLTDDEKSTVDMYIGNDNQYCDFEQVSDLFKENEVKILYWD